MQEGFKRADHITLLLTNPFNNESFDAAASWRNDPANNPFSFDERAFMFRLFFKAMGIGPERYTIKPFNIKDPAFFDQLDPTVPNLVNVYSEWSQKKAALFLEHGLPVVRLDTPKTVPISGTKVRQIIFSQAKRGDQLVSSLLTNGFMSQAVPGLLQVLRNRKPE